MIATPELPFACLDFSGRATVTVKEIARKTGYTPKHIANLIEAHHIAALNGALKASRGAWRVPVDEYRRWVCSILTSTERTAFIAQLPEETLHELQNEIAARLAVLAA
jgi:hypothetical protein